MATYKEIKGVTVQTRDTDPTVNAGTWASGGDLNEGRESAGTSGTLTAGLYAGGYNITANVEKYDGTSWTEVSNLNTGRRQLRAAGTANTANIVFGGDTSGNTSGVRDDTEQWDGSSWTEVNDMNTARSRMASSQYGSVTAAITTGGSTTNPNYSSAVELYDGSSWSETTEMNTTRRTHFGSGISTSTIISSGQHPPGANTVNAETWNGSAWTEVANVNTARNSGGSSGVSNTSSLIFGGNAPPGSAKTEDWDGSSWTEVGDLANTEYDHDGAGTAGDAFSAGGNGYETRTEEWTTAFTPTTLQKTVEGQLYFNSTTNTFKETVKARS